MNIVGKILVFLNLLFALAVGGFLIVDFATRSNWRKAYDSLKVEMEAARVNYSTSAATIAGLSTDVRKANAELETVKQKVIDSEDQLKAKETVHKQENDELKQQAKDADLKSQVFLAEKERLKEEVKKQLEVIVQRDDKIVKLNDESQKNRSKAVAEESARKATQDRLEQALAENARLTQELTKAKTGAASDIAVKGKANPPTVYVEGKIDQIHPQDSSLVSLNVGGDKGLTKNHTLEVYRVDPPLYLGMVRIVDVTAHSAVGRLERVGNANRAPIRVGDTVASSLTRN